MNVVEGEFCELRLNGFSEATTVFSRPHVGEKTFQIHDAGRNPPPRTPSGVFGCYPLVARSNARQYILRTSPLRSSPKFAPASNAQATPKITHLGDTPARVEEYAAFVTWPS